MLEKIKNKGISPFIATVFIILLTFVTISLVLVIALPAINRAKEAALLNEATQNMRMIDNMVREVASEGTGSLRSMQLKVTDGDYGVNKKADSIDFVQTIKYGIVEVGTFFRDGNLMLISGVSAKASEYDLDGDGNDELVLENEILKLGIQKVGSASNQVAINTINNTKIINFIETDVNVTPIDSSVIIDNLAGTSVGTGYSELIARGDHMPKAEAVVHVNSTRVYYEVLYTLQSGADFIIVKIINAHYN